MHLLRRLRLLGLLGALLFLGAALPQSAAALAITLSQFSSGNNPNASVLDATLDFTVIGGDQLQIVVTNDTAAPDMEFDINEIWWMASSDVTSLTLVSATHSVNGDVTAAWDPVETAIMVNGFGVFDFGLTNGTGMGNPTQIQPGTSITFLLDITGACATAMDCDPFDDFLSQANSTGKSVAAKFVNGQPGNKSGFGASAPIPEPGTFALGALGLLGLALHARRRRAR